MDRQQGLSLAVSPPSSGQTAIVGGAKQYLMAFLVQPLNGMYLKFAGLVFEVLGSMYSKFWGQVFQV